MTVQDQEEGRGCGGSVAVVGASVGVEVGSLQAVAHQLALQEHGLAGLSLGDDLAVDRGGLIHGVDLTVLGILVDVLAIGVAVPVLVLLELHGLVGLIVGHLVGTVGHGGLNGGVVGRGEGVTDLLDALVVDGLVHEPVAGQVVQQVEAGQGLLQNQSDLVLAGLQAADGVEGVVCVGVVVGQVVAQLLARLVAPGGRAGELVQSIQSLVVDLNVAVLVSHALQLVVHALGEEAGVVGQGVAAHPTVACIVQTDVHNSAVGSLVEAVVALDQSVQSVGHGLTVRGVSLLNGAAAVGVVVGTCDGQVTVIVVGGAVVHQLGIKQHLHGVDVGVCVDGGAVLPLGVGVQGDLVRVAGGSVGGNAELVAVHSLDVFGHINRHLGCHLGNDDVTGVGVLALNGVQLIVEDEGVQTGNDEVQRIGIIGGLVGVGVPVGCEGADGILPDEVTGEGLNGQTVVCGILAVTAGSLACAEGQQHDQSQQQGDDGSKLSHRFSP